MVGHKFKQIWTQIGTDLILESKRGTITLNLTITLNIFPLYVLKQI